MSQEAKTEQVVVTEQVGNIEIKVKSAPRVGSKKELAWRIIDNMKDQPINSVVEMIMEQLKVTKQNAKVYMWHYNKCHQ